MYFFYGGKFGFGRPHRPWSVERVILHYALPRTPPAPTELASVRTRVFALRHRDNTTSRPP